MMSPGSTESRTFRFLRILALIVLVAGAAGSLGLMFRTGKQNKSVLLMLLFTAWVASPFLLVGLANLISNRWTVGRRKSLYILMLILSIGSLISYEGILSPAGTKPAFIFLVVPLISWLLIGFLVLIPAFRSGKRLPENKD